MDKHKMRKNGTPGWKRSGAPSNQGNHQKVRYGGFTLEGFGKNAIADMRRAGHIGAITYGMMKQTEHSIGIREVLEKKLLGWLFGDAPQPPTTPTDAPDTSDPARPVEEKSWDEAFHETHRMPALYKLPYHLAAILGIFPKGYAEAMLLHVLALFGALCFSRIRAKYLDGKMHAPNIQVVIEAPSGIGKGKFKDVFDRLFSRVIADDNVKYAADSGRDIIQIVSIKTTQAQFFKFTAANKGVHMYLFHPEISHAAQILKQKSGLTYEHLRCAFDNDEVENNSMAKNIQQGRFRTFLNYTLTGTPDTVDRFIAGEEVDGTAQRICWAAVPESCVVDEKETEYPEEDEMANLQDQIDKWRKTYCYYDKAGLEVPCKETVVDLDYVKEALKDWSREQKKLADEQSYPARDAAIRREAAIAFHLAMVLHMLYGQPGEGDAERQDVIDFTLYLADYCMERYLHRFGQKMNQTILRNRQKEQVVSPGAVGPSPVPQKLSPKELYDIYHQTNPKTGKPWSYRDLAEAYPGNGSNVTIMADVKKYAAENGLKVRGKAPK